MKQWWSDEAVVERWSQDVVWQYFSGQDYYTLKLPCDPTQLGRFRRAIGEAGVEEVLKATIDTAVAIKASSFRSSNGAGFGGRLRLIAGGVLIDRADCRCESREPAPVVILAGAAMAAVRRSLRQVTAELITP